MFLSIRITVRIEFKNKEVLRPDGNYIFSLWHENLMGLFVVYASLDREFVWLNHPSWYMKPIHLNLNWHGSKKLAMGSSGNSGKAALAQVVSWLNEGYSTFINPDGPRGPIREIKDGVLNMSIETGVPVVPFKVTSATAYTLPTWDRKRVPLLFTTVTVEYGEPVVVTEENKEEARKSLMMAM
ncbi:MAG: DUF374 domain-containing protein [Flavobacteriales bacterium]|nr:DUF374 domain-containing protein [Flavobacteriales bacterium]